MRFSAATSGTKHRRSTPMTSSSTWASVTPKLGMRPSITPPRNGSLGMFIPTPSKGSGARSSVPLSEPSTRYASQEFQGVRLLPPSCLKHPPTDNRHKTEDYPADPAGAKLGRSKTPRPYRVKAGMARARIEGKHVGRPRLDDRTRRQVRELRAQNPDRSIRAIARETEVPYATTRRLLLEREKPPGN